MRKRKYIILKLLRVSSIFQSFLSIRELSCPNRLGVLHEDISRVSLSSLTPELFPWKKSFQLFFTQRERLLGEITFLSQGSGSCSRSREILSRSALPVLMPLIFPPEKKAGIKSPFPRKKTFSPPCCPDKQKYIRRGRKKSRPRWAKESFDITKDRKGSKNGRRGIRGGGGES